MMPRPALTEEQRGETRQRIRKAAASLYAKNGHKDITARKIADLAGVSVGTLYSHFGSLTELMQSLWQIPVRGLLGELEYALTKQDDPIQRLRAILKVYADFAINQRAVYRGAFLFVRPDDMPKPEQTSLDDDQFFRMLSDAVRDGQTEGVVRKGDPKQLAQTIWAGVHGAIALPINIDRLALQPPEQTLAPMIDTLLEWLQS